ncbi:MAG: ATP-binding protein [Spirochaetia bacterium]|nr:ATP-binding protein [Spirochaetia bacterium]
MEEYKTAADFGYESNKDVIIEKIEKIIIEKFRTIENQEILLGDNLTILSGKNGTMKSSILGLIAHPFSSPNDAVDSFGVKLKTDMKDVFYLSLEKDKEIYRYNLVLKTDKAEYISEPIRVYPRPSEKRHRVTVGKDNTKGLGNFSLNTAYINLKRVYPIVETQAESNDSSLGTDEKKFIAEGYYKILQREDFSEPVVVEEKRRKNTFGPSPTATYDFKSISSGEDNLGHILNKMFAFINYQCKERKLQGVLCIDEVEAALHPIAQKCLLEYLLSWSKKYNIQVVVTSHSLYFIQCALEQQEKEKDAISINMISTAHVSGKKYQVIHNPTYSMAYKELTLDDLNGLMESYLIDILCEDKVAEYYLKTILSSRNIKKRLNFMHDMFFEQEGTGFKTYKALIKNGEKLLENAIVVFDSDVDISSLKGNVSFLKLPSKYEMPLEKELVKYIHDLEGDNNFFKKYKREKQFFLREFGKYNITDYDIDHMKKDDSLKYKNWFRSDPKRNQYINYFAKNNDSFITPFRKKLIMLVNEKLKRKSLPIIAE